MDPDRCTRAKKLRATFYWTFLSLALTFYRFPVPKKRHLDRSRSSFSQYVDAYTTGVISKTSTNQHSTRISGHTTNTVGEPVNEALFDFSPSVQGRHLDKCPYH